MGPRPSKRGRPPKQQSQSEEQSESTADPEVGASNSAVMGEVNSDSVAAEPEAATTEEQTPAEGTVDGDHTCPDCGMSFDRRYTLIMHTLKHEKARGFKCSVSICQYTVFNCKCCEDSDHAACVSRGV